MTSWGRIDILSNNAAILCDQSFVKMPLADLSLIIDASSSAAIRAQRPGSTCGSKNTGVSW